MVERTELLAPAGDFDTALAAFAAGADAVYCGLADFSARAFAKNLSIDELDSLVRFAHSQAGRQVYVTFNTLLDEDQLEGAVDILSRLEQVAPDALIVQDLGVARIIREHFPSLVLHASTQLVAHNLEGVLALRDLGFRRVVLARELSLEEIASIKRRCGDVELEVFIHGALCYSLSGLCLYGAMEKGRSGNRGQCPYCCRQTINGRYPFSMKDLRLGEDARRLSEAGVDSLKIEGRMKSALYVSSVTQYYRGILDDKPSVTETDLETVFSRRTTELYLNGRVSDAIDPESLGHRGTPIGKVKKITKDRDGRSWLRFHTQRPLERHDGLQFDALTDEGRHFGIGISEMRQAISRRNVFEVAAGEDVEILLPDDAPIHSGDNVYCSMSNAVKRRFPAPSFRASDYAGNVPIEVEVCLEPTSAIARVRDVEVRVNCSLDPAKCSEKTFAAVEKAFAKLGGTAYRLKALRLSDVKHLFAPASVMNDLRRDLVEALDKARERERLSKVDAAKASIDAVVDLGDSNAAKILRIRVGQRIPTGDWTEVVVLVDATVGEDALPSPDKTRLALPVFTGELEFNRLRNAVKRLIRVGYNRWEASDLATLRMLRQLGVDNITADWSLYAFNSQSLKTLSELGVHRFVASPENGRENLQYLAESGYEVEFLIQQSTPLFISLHQPASEVGDLSVFRFGELYVTTRTEPRTFAAPTVVSTRVDLSWDPPDPERDTEL